MFQQQRGTAILWIAAVVFSMAACGGVEERADDADLSGESPAELSLLCTDGSELTCRSNAPTCAEGLVPAIQNGCWECIPVEQCNIRGRCGGGSNQSCDAKEYCDYRKDGCGIGNESGRCRPRPEACPTIVQPVCGCDGVTYSNRCLAAEAGVDVLYEAPCLAVPECKDVGPLICTMPRPECADGLIAVVRNGCYACVDSITCQPPKTCGTIAGLECGSDEFCDYTPLQDYPFVCGGDDSGGICKKRPAGCPAHVDPVCGCDHRTYNNGCEANRAGVDVWHQGSCSPIPVP